MIKIDFHIHSCYSKDSLMPVNTIIETLQKRGLNAFALTDHNNMDGVFEARRSGNVKFIPGEEIKTSHGEIIGLFLKEAIPPGLPSEKTVKLIKDQGGLVYVPHPFDRWRSSRIAFPELERIRKDIDIIEIFNGRIITPGDNKKAEEYAKNYDITMGVGSDSHLVCELGLSYVEIEDFSTPEELLEALRAGRRVTSLSSPFIHLGSTYSRLRKLIDRVFLRDKRIAMSK